MSAKEHLWRLFDGSLAMFAALVAVAGVATPAFLLPPAWGFPVSGGLMLVASYSLGAWLREPDYTPSPDWTGAVPEALRQQREFFRERFGCYPEDMTEVCPECHRDGCPLWLTLAEQIRREPGVGARVQLAAEHEVTDDPCTACGGIATCNMFFCYRELP